VINDPCQASANDLACEIAAQRLSPVDVVDAFLARIAKHDPKLHAFVEVYAKEARAGEIGVAQCGAGKVGAAKVAVAEACARQIGIRERRAAQIAAAEVRRDQQTTSEIRALELLRGEIGFREVRARHLQVVELVLLDLSSFDACCRGQRALVADTVPLRSIWVRHFASLSWVMGERFLACSRCEASSRDINNVG
jgi:hypothetical protein